MAEKLVAADLLPKKLDCSSTGLWLHFYEPYISVYVCMALVEVPQLVCGKR